MNSTRDTRLGLASVLATGLLWAAACGDPAPVNPDASVNPDATVTSADTGVTTNPDAMPAPDAEPTDTGVSPIPENTLVLYYHRALADYAGWTVEASGDVAPGTPMPIAQQGPTNFGVRFYIPIKPDAASVTYTLKNGGNSDPAGAITVAVSATAREVWQFSEYNKPLTTRPPAIPGPNEVVAYYQRTDGDYNDWGVHLWGDVKDLTIWTAPQRYEGTDPKLGAYYVIKLNPAAERVNIIVHKGDTKDPGPDMGWNISEQGNIVFILTGSSRIYTTPQETSPYAIRGAAAHLMNDQLLAWGTPAEAASVELRYSPTADIEVSGMDFRGGTPITLTSQAGALTGAFATKFPHLTGLKLYAIGAADRAQLPNLIKGQVVAIARNAAGAPIAATDVQLSSALDELFAYDGQLGVSFAGRVPSFRVWGPTAQSMKLHVYDAAKAEIATVDMTAGPRGTWEATGQEAWYGLFYRYEPKVYHPSTQRIENPLVTDPYSVSLSTNSRYSHIIDVANDASLKPAGWDAVTKPELAAPEDIVIYEGHIRDFSIFDASVPAANRGKYLAFTATGVGSTSNGMAHLRRLAEAGLTHFHILPTFDIATVDEDPANRVDLGDPFQSLCTKNPAVPMALCMQFAGQTILAALESLDGASETQQEIANYVRRYDGFNWGYDPFHFNVPEGSYASDPEGGTRIRELRAMIKGLSEVGLRSVMDVVYNHTNGSGMSDTSVFDKVVPGYYHRRNEVTGFIESSTCCQNTATENTMMEKFMIDSVVFWAKNYKIDAFRFDLMGHHMKSNMVRVRAALDALTVAADGVDGPKVYMYGEGWDFGEVQGGRRGQNAVQANMGGTGIGTFNDRSRDAIRGGGPFDSGTMLRSNQGFATGGISDPNELAATDMGATRTFLQGLDRIKVGMAGNLTTFRLNDSLGFNVNGANVGYNGARTGYTQDPQEVINYASKHDNQTLWDILQFKAPFGRTVAERIRMYNVGLDTILLGGGVPFFHMGDDILRSKSMERDSYDSGDWFNRVDWTYTTNNWRVGLPSAEKDRPNWPQIRASFENFTARPSTAEIQGAHTHFQEMLRIRKSSPLFRLRTGDDIRKRVDFLSVGPMQAPGIIAMSITDGVCGGPDLDPNRSAIFVLFNARPTPQEFTVAGANGFTLHPVQQASADPVVRGASFDSARSTFVVPGRTTAVFEQTQSGAQGDGLPCNAR